MKNLNAPIILLLSVCSLFTFSPASAHLRKYIRPEHDNENIIDNANNIAGIQEKDAGTRWGKLNWRRYPVKQSYTDNSDPVDINIPYFKEHTPQPDGIEKLPINGHLWFLTIVCAAIGAKHLISKSKRADSKY